MTLTNLKRAENDREILEMEFALVEAAIAGHPTAAIGEGLVENFIELCKIKLESVREIHRRIMETAPADAEPHETFFKTLLVRLYTAINKLNGFKKSYLAAQASTAARSSASSTTHAPSLRLPTLDLQKFDGRFEDWQSFQDLFEATIIKNTSLSDAEKLSYLRACVKGDASQLIKSFTITDLHFKEAWDLLNSRYNNKKEIVHSLIRKLLTQPSLKGESISSLQQILNTSNECLRSLRVLGREVDKWDDLLVIIITDKLDADTRADWAKHHRGIDPPTYAEFETFLVDHIRSLHARGSYSTGKRNSAAASSSKTVASNYSSSQPQCEICQESHQIYHCSKFTSMKHTDKTSTVKSKALCFNCLRPGHSVKDCKSKSTCRKCNKRHNTLLHQDQIQKSKPTAAGTQVQNPEITELNGSTTSNFGSTNTQVLLKTVKIKITDSTGIDRICRAVLDDGSQSSFITESCATSLGLNKTKANVTINGISGGTVTTARHMVNIRLSSLIYNAYVDVQALVLPRVTGELPTFRCNHTKWNHIKGIQLADPDFHEPGNVDILLGADVTASIMRDGIKHGPRTTPIAQNTIFGWVLSGRIPVVQESIINSNLSTFDVQKTLERFWELEELPSTHHYTEEEMECEKHFQQTHQRGADGKYTVRLPFNENISKLGLSKEQAISRLFQLEKRFKRQPQCKSEYVSFMKEYLDLNHMELIPDGEKDAAPAYYLPHHFVLQEESSTTKFRVVFDGSAKSSTGYSLNNCMLVGPTVQDDLFSLLLRFRLHPIALKADIAKMYRQFSVAPEDTNYQRIVWRDNEAEDVRIYKLTTVTYGTAAAPFLATRCINQLAEDEKSDYPAASQVIRHDLYVDDLMSGAANSKEAMELVNHLMSITDKAGLKMRKWATNDAEVLAKIQPELRETKTDLNLDTDTTVKALGVKWDTTRDTFNFKVKPSLNSSITKRILLSELAKVFDPLGWITPITIRAKLIFQALWKEKLEWDEPLGKRYEDIWSDYQNQLTKIEEIQVPRCIFSPHATAVEFHGFCDASEKAYAAALYIKITYPNRKSAVNLIASRTKVAPIKQVSLPRLELCGSLLLAELIEHVKSAYKTEYKTFAWTDSTIVLHWLSSYPGRWKTFIANRVAKIQQILPSEHWGHVPSEQNPADCASRGISASELINFDLWWHGASWIETDKYPQHHSAEIPSSEHLEEKRVQVLTVQTEPSLAIQLCHRFSSLLTLKRVTAYILRFTNNIKNSKNKVTDSLSVEEIHQGFTYLIKSTQNCEFEEEIAKLGRKLQLPTSSKLSQLNPYIDGAGLLRVGGRLHKSTEPEEYKHPIILPHNHPLTTLIIRDCHQRNMHSGFQLTFSTLRQEYWILRGRDTTRHIIRKCITCRRQRAAITEQLMGNLPSPRVNPSRPFLHCGVDYAGPYSLLPRRGRGQKTVKCYFSIFVCLVTKAIHLEAVHDLTTYEFIAAYKRFISRRGIPSNMYSDNGTTFIGADKELQRLHASAKHNSAFADELSRDGTNWAYNCSSASHQGGIWEAGVKAVKFHLKRVVGKTTPTIKEFETLLCMVEACLNSRPLCAMSNDPTDFSVLTPGHFIIGCSLNSVPEPDLAHLNSNRLSNWQHMQLLFQHFWKRWRGEYLTTLQQRFKWKTKRANLQVGDLVIIKEDNTPPMKWKLGRIIAAHTGEDGCVRVATVRASRRMDDNSITTSDYQRPITKLCPILSNDE